MMAANHTSVPAPKAPAIPIPPPIPGLSQAANSYVGRVREVGHDHSKRFLVAGAMAKNLRPEHMAHRRVELWSSQEEKRWRGKAIPPDVGFVFIMTAWMSHPASIKLLEACRAQRVLYAMGLQAGELKQLLDIGLAAKNDTVAPKAGAEPVEPPAPKTDNLPPEWQRPAKDAPQRQATLSASIRELGLDLSKPPREALTDEAWAVLHAWHPEYRRLAALQALSHLRLAAGYKPLRQNGDNRKTRAMAEQERASEATPPAQEAVAPPVPVLAPTAPIPEVERPVTSIEDALAAIDGATRALMKASDALQQAREAVLHARTMASEDIAKLVEDGMLDALSKVTGQIRGKQA